MSHLSEAILRDTNGVILTLQDAMVASLLRDYADFFVIDAASRPFPSNVIQEIVFAARDTPVLVRVENNLPSTLQNYLNLGVDGLILTDVHYASEVEKAIASCLYPPEGIRHYRGASNVQPVSLQALNDQVTLIVEICSPQAVTQIEEICEVTGINGVLVSPERIAVAMEAGFETAQENVQACLRQVYTSSRGYELPFGLEGEGFDCEPDFGLALRDVDLLTRNLVQVAEQSGDDGLFQRSIGVSDYDFEEENAPMLLGSADDDDFGSQLVARR